MKTQTKEQRDTEQEFESASKTLGVATETLETWVWQGRLTTIEGSREELLSELRSKPEIGLFNADRAEHTMRYPGRPLDDGFDRPVVSRDPRIVQEEMEQYLATRGEKLDDPETLAGIQARAKEKRERTEPTNSGNVAPRSMCETGLPGLDPASEVVEMEIPLAMNAVLADCRSLPEPQNGNSGVIRTPDQRLEETGK